MHFKVTLLTILLLPSLAQAQYSSKRKLLLIADESQDSQLLKQEEILQADLSGLAERDLSIITITPSSNKTLYTKWNKDKKDFRLILIGKDGGEKFTSDIPISCKELYAIIDAMPMRKEEIKNDNRN